MVILGLVISLLLQNPAPQEPASGSAASAVVVGLLDGEKVVVDSPVFAGFIETRDPGQAVLIYRSRNFSGEMDVATIQRIDFGYTKGKPFLLGVTLKNGTKLDVESARRNFVTIKGPTGSGTVLIKHPDPVSHPLRLKKGSPDRKHDLTIQYLEFPL